MARGFYPSPPALTSPRLCAPPRLRPRACVGVNRHMPLVRFFYASCALCLLACSRKPVEPAAPAPAAPAPAPAPAANAPTAVPAAPPPAAPAAPAAPAGGPEEEACARAIVVAFKGADPPTEGVTRDKAAAEARARELLA